MNLACFCEPFFPESFRQIIGNHLPMKQNGFNHSGNVLCYVSGCKIDTERAVGCLPSTSNMAGWKIHPQWRFQTWLAGKSTRNGGFRRESHC